MKKSLLFTAMCILGLLSLNAQETNPVKWINATDNGTSVVLSWTTGFSTTNYEDFETNGIATRDWKLSEEHPWTITENAYEGNFAIKSTCEGVDYGKSYIELTVDIKSDGFVGFYHRISSEAFYDAGDFYIDSVMKSSISGSVDWKYVEYFVTAGTHVYKWIYTKDSSTNSGEDAYFVDNITFYKEPEQIPEGWLYYDNGSYSTSIGTGKIEPTYWGVSFPADAELAGKSLSKIAVFDSDRDGNSSSANYTANIYLGGENAPETLASTQEFQMTGTNGFVEIELENPVELDGTKTLWITLFCDELLYPAAGCETVNISGSDWLSLDGNVWKHAYEYGLNVSWMLRGYLQDSNGNVKTLSNYSTTKDDSTNEFLYNIYRKNTLDDNSQVLLQSNITDTVFVDETWSSIEFGSFKWGVSVMTEEGESEILWSKEINKDMFTKVTVSAQTNSQDPAKGTYISFVNLNENGYKYSGYMNEDGTLTFDEFRKGTYEFTVTKDGFSSDYENKTVEIKSETSFNVELKEIISPINNLYVSPTGWAMWDGISIGKGDEFSDNFDDDGIDGWVNIDADGDGHAWTNIIEYDEYGYGHNSSNSCVCSESYINNLGPVIPDNYLVTDRKYHIGPDSQLRFWVCAQDASWSDEHYGVAVSLLGNTSSEDFIMVWEETFSTRSERKAIRGTTAQTEWVEKVIDLSEYSGQNIYIALRHFNCTDMYRINVDDIELVNASKPDRSLTSYKVYLNNNLITENLNVPYYQFENLTAGQEYTAKVIPVYSTGEAEATEYTWTHTACDDFEDASDFNAELIDGETTISWILPSDALGVMLHRNGVMVSKLVKGESYKDKNAKKGDEYTLRVVYDGEKDVTYYAMSCPQSTEVTYDMPCAAPKNLNATSVANEDGSFGAMLAYPYLPSTSDWIYYGDGIFVTSIGGPSSYYWGIMFPIEMLEPYASTNITKVAFYDFVAQDGTVNIYYGGDSKPEMLVHSQGFTTTGSGEFVDIDLTYPLPIDGDMNIWIVLGTNNGTAYPSALSSSIDNPNARWISVDGKTWEDAATYGFDGTWMIRAFVTNEAKGTTTPLETVEFVNTATGGTLAMNPNPTKTPTLRNYNIYRGTSLDNIELIAETTEKRYFDEIERGTYYYQVTAVYEENGEICESEPANAYNNPEQNYVVVEVTSISENGINGMMIYPNPTNGKLNIKAETMTHVSVFNTLGQVVYERETDNDNETIDMSRFESGIYMVRIVTENGIAVKRITVSR